MAAERVYVITGANTGIGRASALELAKSGARVVLACRSEEKTRPVIDELRSATGNERIEFLSLDLSRLSDVRRAAAELLSRDHPIHVLINNAGLAGKRAVTADGFEIAFGVNHLGHFLFTSLLLDRVKASAPARIVNVSSKAHLKARGIDFAAVRERTRAVTGLPEYEVSKLCNVLHAAELARRLDGSGVTTYSLHPGVIASDAWREIPWPVRALMKAFMKSNEEGARTTVFCATAPELADESGEYYDECKRAPANPLAADVALAAELWAKSEEWVASAAG